MQAIERSSAVAVGLQCQRDAACSQLGQQRAPFALLRPADLSALSTHLRCAQAHITVDQNYPEGAPRKIIVQVGSRASSAGHAALAYLG